MGVIIAISEVHDHTGTTLRTSPSTRGRGQWEWTLYPPLPARRGYPYPTHRRSHHGQGPKTDRNKRSQLVALPRHQWRRGTLVDRCQVAVRQVNNLPLSPNRTPTPPRSSEQRPRVTAQGACHVVAGNAVPLTRGPALLIPSQVSRPAVARRQVHRAIARPGSGDADGAAETVSLEVVCSEETTISEKGDSR